MAGGTATGSGITLRRVNDSVKLSVTLARGGVPQSGKPAFVRFVRRSDGRYYNWTLNSWQVPVFDQALSEVYAGVYEVLFDQATADPNVERDYLAIFHGNGVAADKFYGSLEYSFKSIAAPGDQMNLTTAAIQAVRAEMMNYVVGGNILGLTMENTLDWIRKILNNRLELADGAVANWVLYDDDDSTVFLTYDVRDKSNAAIFSPAAVPARRTRGA